MEIHGDNGSIMVDRRGCTVNISIHTANCEPICLTEDGIAELNDLLADWLVHRAVNRQRLEDTFNFKPC